MKNLRSRIIFILFVYFAGFSTAVYYLAPAAVEGEAAVVQAEISENSSQEFLQSFNAGMHKCVDVAKDATIRAGGFIKGRLEEKIQDMRDG